MKVLVAFPFPTAILGRSGDCVAFDEVFDVRRTMGANGRSEGLTSYPFGVPSLSFPIRLTAKYPPRRSLLEGKRFILPMVVKFHYSTRYSPNLHPSHSPYIRCWLQTLYCEKIVGVY